MDAALSERHGGAGGWGDAQGNAAVTWRVGSGSAVGCDAVRCGAVRCGAVRALSFVLQDQREAFHYPSGDESGDIANDDHLDDSAERRLGRAVSSHGFNFDYAEGGDEYFGTAQRRVTSVRSLSLLIPETYIHC